MLFVEAELVMPSVTGCRTLSTPIGKPKPSISDGRRSRYTFAASFNAVTPEEKTINSTKKLLKVFHEWSQFVNGIAFFRYSLQKFDERLDFSG